MKFYSSTVAPRRYFLAVLTLLSLKSLSAPTDNRDLQENSSPENWYQVEVILFTQQNHSDAETAPQDYQLQFPENWLELVDPDQATALIHLPIVSNSFDYSSIYDSQLNLLQDSLSAIDSKRVWEQLDKVDIKSIIDKTAIPEASIPYKYQNQPIANPMETGQTVARNIEEAPIKEEITPIFVPEYEQPFQQLEPEFRDLNHSAAALDRRNYNVLFHQAWRLQINQNEQSPWVLVKAGSTDTDRYQIEGTIRFYKSRFLHFESNLWRLKFANEKTNLLELPEIPKKSLSPFKELMLNALSFSKGLSNMSPEQTTTTTDSELFDIRTSYNLNSILGSTHDKGADNIAYPIDAVWPFDQSKRLHEGEVYYIDHPEMGALVTVKSYQPEPLNLPPAQNADVELEVKPSI